MSGEDRVRWDRRYATGDYTPRTAPSPFLERWLPHLPVGRALDIACGTGRHALRLAEEGFDVHAVDISTVAVDRAAREGDRRGLAVEWEVVDLDELAIPAGAYDLVVVMRYRDPALWPKAVTALAPDGWLLVEHHLRTTVDVGGPQSPEFRVAPHELLRAAEGLRVLQYTEELEEGDAPGSRYAIARLAACNGDPGF